jgi:hypothetical protein
VGVDLETIIVLFQSTVTSFGLLTDSANREPKKQIAINEEYKRALPDCSPDLPNLREAADFIAYTRFKVLEGCASMFATHHTEEKQ